MPLYRVTHDGFQVRELDAPSAAIAVRECPPSANTVTVEAVNVADPQDCCPRLRVLAGNKPGPGYDPRTSVIENFRAHIIERMERAGTLHPDCPTCRKAYAYERPCDYVMPSHTAKPGCESGRHNHCTCDVCF